MANVKLGNNVFKNVDSIGMITESNESVIFPKYVIGNPIDIVLSIDNWSGTTYQLKIENYKIGEYGVQVGMPSVSNINEAQTILECALTISASSYTAATSDAAAYSSIRLSAINTPTKDITISLFGLEEV